jgi:hypothetical protein
MNHISSLRLLLAIGLLSQASCIEDQPDPVAPPTSENLSVSVQHRAPAPGEGIPRLQLAAGAGSVTIRVSRPALCGTLVTAGVSRGTRDLTIVARVSPDPLALCAASVSPYVVDYEGTVSALAPGDYEVRVFEGMADREPRFLGSGAVRVTSVQ